MIQSKEVKVKDRLTLAALVIFLVQVAVTASVFSGGMAMFPISFRARH